MQDDPPQRDDLKAKWGKIYQDILSACGKLVTVEGGIYFDSYENSVDLSEFDCDPDHSQAAHIWGSDDPPQDEVNVTDVGSLSREAGAPLGIDYPEMTFCEFSFGVDKIKAWDVDLGEFLNDIEEDPDAATMLGAANDFDLDAERNEVDLDAGLNEIDPDLEESSQDELEDKEHLMPFFSLFACFILMVICAGFLISMFLGYV